MFDLQIFSWFPEYKGFHFGYFKNGMALIYKWSLILGFIEIRKWV